MKKFFNLKRLAFLALTLVTLFVTSCENDTPIDKAVEVGKMADANAAPAGFHAVTLEGGFVIYVDQDGRPDFVTDEMLAEARAGASDNPSGRSKTNGEAWYVHFSPYNFPSQGATTSLFTYMLQGNLYSLLMRSSLGYCGANCSGISLTPVTTTLTSEYYVESVSSPAVTFDITGGSGSTSNHFSGYGTLPLGSQIYGPCNYGFYSTYTLTGNTSRYSFLISGQYYYFYYALHPYSARVYNTNSTASKVRFLLSGTGGGTGGENTFSSYREVSPGACGSRVFQLSGDKTSLAGTGDVLTLWATATQWGEVANTGSASASVSLVSGTAASSYNLTYVNGVTCGSSTPATWTLSFNASNLTSPSVYKVTLNSVANNTLGKIKTFNVTVYPDNW